MKKILSFIVLIFSMSFYFSQEKIIINDVPTIKYEMLEKKIQDEKDVLLVLNFWSTTCAPCVKELPDFMEVNNKYKSNPKFKMLLVSLDRPKDKERVIQFIKSKKLSAEVILLDDIKRMNTWIPQFEKNWDGNIPVTIIYKNSEKVHFNDGEMTKVELENVITKNL
ncbi:TlpA family protein disulfide reductase [Chryseobacterium indoltheticum]|uniref:TlpA family protein disulfide reductase n=1 Tax=Chryseobacterium indoltheticum TaxID=254 RepID=A0A3G6N5S8_9FLAO|nr:TlpA disulfide reductase family protein [Chryseobacterium indoltheticum]AZA61788.1 TlpA family protein disulfide reductase [Chryseobacterium indoltheticum]QQQ27057.1 TlpA family protein disulfide reductase [Chryseobacterium indoltheticum]